MSPARAPTILMLFLLFGVPSAVARQSVPLPRPRPSFHDSQPLSSSARLGDRAIGEDEPCLARLRSLGVRFEQPGTPSRSDTACVIEVPVRLQSIPAAPTGINLRLPEEPVLSCELAERLSDWLGNLVAPLIRGRMSADLTAVRTGPGYECRNRNGLADGKLSAHAMGKAVDISSFALSNGKSIPVKADGGEAAQVGLVVAIRTAACGWFTTILGPGSDAFHTDHLHLDILLHGTSDRYRICQPAVPSP